MESCPQCAHIPLQKNGKGKTGNQRYRCPKCYKNFTPTLDDTLKLTKAQLRRIKFYQDSESIAYCHWPRRKGYEEEDYDSTGVFTIRWRDRAKDYPKVLKSPSQLKEESLLNIPKPLNIPELDYDYLPDSEYEEDELLYFQDEEDNVFL